MQCVQCGFLKVSTNPRPAIIETGSKKEPRLAFRSCYQNQRYNSSLAVKSQNKNGNKIIALVLF
jgi:hypothetical protein